MADLGLQGMTTAVVTHEMDFVPCVADKVVLIFEGRIVEFGSPADIFDAPKRHRLPRFLAEALGSRKERQGACKWKM